MGAVARPLSVSVNVPPVTPLKVRFCVSGTPMAALPPRRWAVFRVSGKLVPLRAFWKLMVGLDASETTVLPAPMVARALSAAWIFPWRTAAAGFHGMGGVVLPLKESVNVPPVTPGSNVKLWATLTLSGTPPTGVGMPKMSVGSRARLAVKPFWTWFVALPRCVEFKIPVCRAQRPIGERAGVAQADVGDSQSPESVEVAGEQRIGAERRQGPETRGQDLGREGRLGRRGVRFAG